MGTKGVGEPSSPSSTFYLSRPFSLQNDLDDFAAAPPFSLSLNPNSSIDHDDSLCERAHVIIRSMNIAVPCRNVAVPPYYFVIPRERIVLPRRHAVAALLRAEDDAGWAPDEAGNNQQQPDDDQHEVKNARLDALGARYRAGIPSNDTDLAPTHDHVVQTRYINGSYYDDLTARCREKMEQGTIGD